MAAEPDFDNLKATEDYMFDIRRRAGPAEFCKEILTRVGSNVSSRSFHNLDAALNYLAVGRWMREHKFDVSRRFRRREELFDLVGSRIFDREVLYLEFGVWKGAATRYWSKLLRNPHSNLHGFDSFEGLPESWTVDRPKNHFSLDGRVPELDDSRVEFFKGWFDDTLATYKPPSHEVVVAVIDADLYSSTKCVLNFLEGVIAPGSYLYFDDFNHRNDEPRAFEEFMSRTGRSFSLVGATRVLSEVMFQVV